MPPWLSAMGPLMGRPGLSPVAVRCAHTAIAMHASRRSFWPCRPGLLWCFAPGKWVFLHSTSQENPKFRLRAKRSCDDRSGRQLQTKRHRISFRSVCFEFNKLWMCFYARDTRLFGKLPTGCRERPSCSWSCQVRRPPPQSQRTASPKPPPNPSVFVSKGRKPTPTCDERLDIFTHRSAD